MYKVQNALLWLGLILWPALALDICEFQMNGVRLAHPADCSKFVVCDEGKTDRIMSCPFGLHFNRFKAVCDIRQRAACDMEYLNFASEETDCSACCGLYGCVINPNCPATPTPPEPECPDTPPTPSTPGTPPTPETPPTPGPNGNCSNNTTICTNKPNGSVSHVNGTCNQYIVCVGGCANIMTCPNNLQYNLATHICDYPENVDCPWKSTPPTTGPSGVTCAQPGKCAEQPDGTMFVDPKNNGYIVCQCECEIERPCPVGTKFDEQLLTCASEGGINNGNGNGSGNGNGNGSGNGIDNGNGSANSSGSGSENGNGNCTENGSGNGNGNNNEGGNGNGNGNGSGNSNGSGSGNGNGNDNGNGSENSNGNGNGNGSENGSGSGNENDNGSGNENGSGDGSENGNGTTTVVCKNDVEICKNQTEGTLFPVDGVCNKFYKCNYGCAAEILCPNNLVYNPNTKYCDYPQNYKCPWSYTPPSGPSAGPSGIACASGGRCIGQAEGTKFPSLNSCSKYVVCQCECEVEMNCSKGLLWDMELLTCNYPENVKCTLS